MLLIIIEWEWGAVGGDSDTGSAAMPIRFTFFKLLADKGCKKSHLISTWKTHEKNGGTREIAMS